MPVFSDLADLPEDERIRIIAQTAAAGHTVGVIVDNGDKADRYMEKLTPYAVRIIDRGPGPVQGTVLLRIGPRTQ